MDRVDNIGLYKFVNLKINIITLFQFFCSTAKLYPWIIGLQSREVDSPAEPVTRNKESHKQDVDFAEVSFMLSLRIATFKGSLIK